MHNLLLRHGSYLPFSNAVSSSNLAGSFSKGYGSSGDDGCGDIDICPDLLLAGLAAAGAAAFVVLFTLITMNGRKKKRSLSGYKPVKFVDVIRDFLWAGSSTCFGVVLGLITCMRH